MPTIQFEERKIYCARGAQLREVLIRHGIVPHNGNSRYLNCMGVGTCGTCAVRVTGHVSPLNAVERMRLSLPPHKPGKSLRLSCQTKVLGDIIVEKGKGFWGQEI
jgi:ferredoxin